MAPARRRAEPGGRGLARGLARGVLAERARDALFDLAAGGPRLVELDVGSIAPNPDQPRRRVDEAGIAGLAASVERHGLLQPIAVRDAGGGAYVLVAGQRRLLAHKALGRGRIAALIVDGAPDELALVENLQRQDLAPLEEAEALAALRARHGHGLDELARIVGRAKSTVSELLSLNDLAEAVKAEVRTSEPPVAKSVLVEVAKAGDAGRQLALWRRLRRGGATVRAARSARGGVRTSERPTEASSPAPVRTSELLAAGRRLLAGLEGLDAGTARAEPGLAELLDGLRRELDRLAG